MNYRYLFKFIFINAFFLFKSSIFALSEKDIDLNNPIIFVDNKEQIPSERDLRAAYFFVLLAYNEILVDSFIYELSLLYGDNAIQHDFEGRRETEGIKEDFFGEAAIAENDAGFILTHERFSREELYQYQRMLRRLTVLFNELFE